MCELSSGQFSTTDLGTRFQIGFGPTIVRHSLQTRSNSLSRNILDVSPCGSIFYPDQGQSHSDKSLKMNILEEQPKKMLDRATQPLLGSTAPFCTPLPLPAPYRRLFWIDS